MMPFELYRQAQTLGLTIKNDGGDLIVSPGSKCPADFVRLLKEHKPELLRWLNTAPCPGWGAVPPADLPLNPVVPRSTPADRERVIAYLRRQTGDRPGPLTAWLVRRENAYYDGPGRKWDCSVFAFAAARDAACWQLKRTEAELLEFLAAPEEIVRGPNLRKDA